MQNDIQTPHDLGITQVMWRLYICQNITDTKSCLNSPVDNVDDSD